MCVRERENRKKQRDKIRERLCVIERRSEMKKRDKEEREREREGQRKSYSEIEIVSFVGLRITNYDRKSFVIKLLQK